MRVLIIKTSSLGDLIHTFPAVTDALRQKTGIVFDWLVEEDFAEVPAWHPGIQRVIPIALRRWRRNWWQARQSGQIKAFTEDLRRTRYDRVLDAQGLLKSALPARLARGSRAGFDRASAREPLASLFYQQRYTVPREQHAIMRLRQLFAQALAYPLPDSAPDYGLTGATRPRQPVVLFLHSTSWESKHWPEAYWAELAQLAAAVGLGVQLPWYAPEERLRAERIIKLAGTGVLLPRLGLSALRERLQTVQGVVGVDTGLAHIAAAESTPAVTLYGPTDARLTGALGSCQANLKADFPCAPCLQRHCSYAPPAKLMPACFAQLTPQKVWQLLFRLMEQCR